MSKRCPICKRPPNDITLTPGHAACECPKPSKTEDVVIVSRSIYDKLAEHNGTIGRELHTSQELAKRMASERDKFQQELTKANEFKFMLVEERARSAELEAALVLANKTRKEYVHESKVEELLSALEKIKEWAIDGGVKIARRDKNHPLIGHMYEFQCLASEAIKKHNSGKGG